MAVTTRPRRAAISRLHEQALSTTRRPSKTEGSKDAPDVSEAQDPKAGKGRNLRLKRNERKEVPSGPNAEGLAEKTGEASKKAYPAGRRLTPRRSPERCE